MIIDSDILIYFLKGDERVTKLLSSIKQDELFTTRINYTKLLYGAYNSQRVDKNLAIIKDFLSNFNILEFDDKSSLVFAKIKAQLKQQGNIIADMDLMIASIAISQGQTLFTNNLKHFTRIEKLKCKSLNFA